MVACNGTRSDMECAGRRMPLWNAMVQVWKWYGAGESTGRGSETGEKALDF